LEEYAAEASKYGSGTSNAVNASGRENHEEEAAGRSLKLGAYVLMFTSFLPRSDSPLALPFIDELEWLCECVCPECEWSWEWLCPFAWTASIFVLKAFE
jgi:hypothetical protein